METGGRVIRVRRIMLLGGFVLAAASMGVTQRSGLPQQLPTSTTRQQQPSTRPLTLPSLDPGEDANPMAAKNEDQQNRSRNSDRQRRLKSDTDTLLRLATELKTDVDKTNKDVLSIDVIKKAEEIEKLAHSVKERMKG